MASSTSSGDPTAAMESPIKVVSHIRQRGGGAIDAGRSARKPLSLWLGMYHSPVTNALLEARFSIFEPMVDSGSVVGGQQQRPQTELLTKTPAQSRTSIVYKFADDDILREQYRDPWNVVRIGKLLEYLDALAGTVAVKLLQIIIPVQSEHLTISYISDLSLLHFKDVSPLPPSGARGVPDGDCPSPLGGGAGGGPPAHGWWAGRGSRTTHASRAGDVVLTETPRTPPAQASRGRR